MVTEVYQVEYPPYPAMWWTREKTLEDKKVMEDESGDLEPENQMDEELLNLIEERAKVSPTYREAIAAAPTEVDAEARRAGQMRIVEILQTKATVTVEDGMTEPMSREDVERAENQILTELDLEERGYDETPV